MSAELRRGDAIHLAIPYDGARRPRETFADGLARIRREAAEAAATLTANYEAMGVRVAFWSANSTLACPTVVAVFRGADPVTLPGGQP